MRTEFVYSLVALGAIPVTANATVNAYVDATSHVVATEGVYLNAGELVRGKYKLKTDAITVGAEDAKLTYEIIKIVNSVESKVATAEVEKGKAIEKVFDLDGTATVKIHLVATTGTVTVGGVQIEAVFDYGFVNLANDLQKEYNAAMNEWNAYSYDVKEYTSKDYQSQINSIKSADGTDGYAIYKKYDLGAFKSTADFQLFKDINTDRKNAKATEVETLGGDGTDYDKAKKAYDALSAFLKGDKKDVTKKYNAAADAYAKLASDEGFDGTGDAAKAAQTAIKQFIDAVDEAQKTDKANTDAYNELKKLSDAVVNYTDNAENTLAETLKGAKYADLKAQADVEFAAAKGLVTTAATAVETAKTAGTAVAKTDELKNQINTAKEAVTDVVTNYTLLKEDLDKAYKTYDGKVEEVNKKITAEIRGYADLATQVKAVDDAVEALLLKIEANDTKEKIANLSNLTSETTAIDNALKEFDKANAVYTDYLNMKKAVATEFDGDNESNWTKALTEVSNYAKNDANKLNPATYNVATLWNAVKTALQDQKAALDAKIDAHKADASDYKNKDEYKNGLKGMQTEIANFKKNATAAVDIYAGASKDYTEAAALYNEVKPAVEGLDIYEGTVNGNDRTPYKTKLAELNKKFTDVKGYLDTSLEKTASKDPVADKKPNENNHLGYLNSKGVTATTLDATIATLKAMKENYKQDQKDWEAQRDAQIAANIHQNVVDLAAQYKEEIADAQKDDKGKAIDFGPLAQELADAIKPVTDLIDAKVAVTGGIEAQTKAYNELDAIDEAPDGELYKLLNTTIPAIKAKLADYTAVMANYNSVDFKAAKENVKKKDPNDTYFTALLDGEYKTEYDNLKAEILKADWSKAETKTTMNGKVDALKTKVNATPALAEANKTAYDAAKARYNTKDDKNTAIPAYNDAVATMKKYPSSELDNQLTVLDTYKDSFDKLLADAEASYKAGKAVADDYNGKLTTKIAEMKAKVAQWTDEVNYNVQIAKDNKTKYEKKTLVAKDNAQKVYEKAASDINAYNYFKSQTMVDAAADANEEKEALLEILDGFNTKLAKIAKAAEDAYVETVSPAIYDPLDIYEAQFNDAAKEVTDAKTAFINKVKEALDSKVPATITAYDDAIKASKAKAKKFTSKADEEVKDGDIKTWYAAIDGKLANVNTQWTAAELDLAALDNSLVAAEHPETGIYKSIETLEGQKAQAALKGITLTPDERKCLKGADGDRWDELDDLRNNDSKRADMVANFDSYKSELLALQKKAKDNKQNEDSIIAGETALDALQDAITAEYNRIDKYAAGAKVKATVDGYQSQHDNFGEVTLENYNDAITLKNNIAGYEKDKKKVRGQIDNNLKPALFDAELPILQGMVQLAETEFITYAASVDEATADGVKAQINALKTTVANIEKIANGEKVGGIEKKDKQFIIDLADDNAYSMVKAENDLSGVIKALQDANQTNTNAVIAADLTKQVNDQVKRLDNWDKDIALPKYYYEYYLLKQRCLAIVGTEATTGKDGSAELIRKYIAANTNKIASYTDNVDIKIAELTEEIDKFLSDVQAVDGEYIASIKAKFDNAEVLMSDKEEDGGAGWLLKTAKNELDVYGATSKYSNKLKQIQNLINEMNETIAVNKAKAETISDFDDLKELATTTEVDSWKLYDTIDEDLDEIVGLAKDPFVTNAIKDLNDQLKAVTINPDEYTENDFVTLDDMKADIQTAINQLETVVGWAGHMDKKNENYIEHTAAVVKSLLESGTKDIYGYEEILGKNGVEAAIQKLKEKMKELNFTQDKKGHIANGGANEEINEDDLEALADIILNDEEYDLEACDLNGDGDVDVSDLVILRYFCVHKKWPAGIVAVREMAGGANDAIDMQVVSVNGNTTRLAVNLTNDTMFRDFQIKLQLPAGAKLVGKSLGERVEGVNLMSSNATNGTVNFVGLATTNGAINGADGSVLYLDVENLNGEVTISKAIFVDNSLVGHDLVGASEATGIRETIANAVNSATQKFFDVSGRMMNSLKNGINIIRNNDGTSKKVLKK